MIEYRVIKLKVDKDLTLKNVYEAVHENVKNNRNFFQIINLFTIQKFFNKIISKNLLRAFDDSGINDYFKRIVNENMIRYKEYQPDLNDWFVYSNLNEVWKEYNESNDGSIEEEQFIKILNFFDSLSSGNYHSLMIGIDEIEWDGAPVNKGTYGYEKAMNRRFGYNYLSNSVIFSKDAMSKNPNVVYVSCESIYRESNALNRIINSLGKVDSEEIFFAPENENERSEWVRIRQIKENKLKEFTEDTDHLTANLPHAISYNPRIITEKHDTIDTKKSVKEVLCKDGWKIVKRKGGGGITVSKTIGDEEYEVWILSLHRGVHIQFHLTCSHPLYRLSVRPGYDAYVSNENESDKCMENIAVFRDAFVNKLTSKD